MIGKSGAAKKPVTFVEALSILEGRKEDGELGYEQKFAYDHMKKFVSISAKSAKEMEKSLGEAGASKATAIKIINIMPVDLAQLKHILVKEKKTFEEEDVRKMMEIVDSHRGK